MSHVHAANAAAQHGTSAGTAAAAKAARAQVKPPAANPAADGVLGTTVSFGETALSALDQAGKFVGNALIGGAEEVADAAEVAVKAVGTGIEDVVAGVEDVASESWKLLQDGGHGLVVGVGGAFGLVATGIKDVEGAAGDVWGVLTQGVTQTTALVGSLGTNTATLANKAGAAATNVGQGAAAVLNGVGNVAGTVADYGVYVAKAGKKLVNEIG